MMVLVSLASASAMALPIEAGAELGLLMREEAGGQRSVLPAIKLQGDLPLGTAWSIGGEYVFAFVPEGNAIVAFTQHHRLTVRPQWVLPLGHAALTLGAGPTLALVSFRFSSSTGGYGTTYPRAMATGELGFEVRLASTHLRVGTDVMWSPGRTDLLISLGATFGFGGAR
jgi:hypothetical protein